MGGKNSKDSGSKDTGPQDHHSGRSRDEIASLVNETITDKDTKKKLLANLDAQTKQVATYKKLCADDFECLTIIGRGAFGEVWIARLKKDQQVFALKRMLKKDMVKKHQTAHIRAERDVLALADNPWIVKLHYSFQDHTWLYLAMEFLQGGDLMTILIKKDILSHKECAFYMAELCIAVESVHQLNYIHRDLKPDNILFDRSGHLKLSDFGLCKSFDCTDFELHEEKKSDGPISSDQQSHSQKGKAWKTDRRKLAHSMVGTPDYMAPEIFTQKGYGKEVDWWSIGVIMYECLVGYAPFYGERPVESARKIVKFEDHFIFPPEIELSPAAEDLMHKLVARSPKRREFVSDFNHIKTHPFFSKINWTNIREEKAIIIPELKDDVDAAMFDNFKPMEDPETATVDQGGGDFVGYTYKKDDDSKRAINVDTFAELKEDVVKEGSGEDSGEDSEDSVEAPELN